MDITIDEGIDMDSILTLLQEVEKKHGRNQGADLNYISTKLHKEKGITYTFDLLTKMLSCNPSVVVSSGREIHSSYNVTPFAKTFLFHGGFIKIAEEIESKAILEAEKEKLNYEKLKYDVKNAKRIFKTYWITFFIAIFGFLISLILLILKIAVG